MDYKAKLEEWFKFARAKRIGWSYRRPPIDFFLQKLGCRIPPIVFWSFGAAASVLGINFGIIWGVLMYLMVWKKEQAPISEVFAFSIFTGAMFGLLMAWLYSRLRQKNNLPSWDQFPK